VIVIAVLTGNNCFFALFSCNERGIQCLDERCRSLVGGGHDARATQQSGAASGCSAGRGDLCSRLLHTAGIPRRKESFEQIRELPMNILAEMPVRTTPHADAAWRRAVETRLQRAGIIATSEPNSVTRFP
jgi:hypothetical protein